MNKDQAQAEADALCKQLAGRWTTEVWKNLEWHYRVISACGRITVQRSHAVHPTQTPWYLARLADPVDLFQWSRTAATPQEAVSAVIEAGRTYASQLAVFLEGLPGS